MRKLAVKSASAAAVKETTPNIGVIPSAVEERTLAGDGIARHVERIALKAEANSAVVDRVDAATRDVAALSARLQAAAQRFKP